MIHEWKIIPRSREFARHIDIEAKCQNFLRSGSTHSLEELRGLFNLFYDDMKIGDVNFWRLIDMLDSTQRLLN